MRNSFHAGLDRVLEIFTCSISRAGRSKPSAVFTAVLLLLSQAGSFASSPVLLLTPKNIEKTRNDIGGTVGNIFAALTSVEIDRLGVFDAGGDGLTTAHQVGIWESITGVLVASATVPRGTEGELIDGFRYIHLPAPISLKAGTPYRIGALFYRGGDAFADSSGYEGAFVPGKGVRLDGSVSAPGNKLAPPTSAAGGDLGVWTGAARWAAANALAMEKADPLAVKSGFTPPPLTPRVEMVAEWTKHTNYGVFQPGEQVELWVQISGRRLGTDMLQWTVTDWKGDLVGRGAVEVPAPEEAKLPGLYSMTYKSEYRDWQETRPKIEVPPWQATIKIPYYGPGYFSAHLQLEKNKATLPQLLQRPAGIITYAVLPKITPLPLKHVDDSRFGLQGFAYVETGEPHRGNMIEPVYSLAGARWCYLYRRLQDVADAKALADVPTLEKAARLWRDERGAGLCPLISITGMPPSMAKPPEGVKGFAADNYPPADFAAYGKLVGKFAAEQVMVRRTGGFPDLKRNYYEIHWEPDWHWKGSDEDFIKMYAAASGAIRANDPDGLLLGPNYGVLPTGLKHLKKLLPMGLAQYLDGMTTHSYGSWPDRVLSRDVRELVALTRQYLKSGAPIMQTELEGSFHHPTPSTESQRTASAMRGHLIWLGEGADTTWFFYVTGTGLFYNLTGMDVARGDFTHLSPRPAFATFAAMTRLLEGTKTIGPVDYLGEEIKAYAFRREEKIILALWAADAVGSCEEPVRSVQVPAGVAEVTFYDPVGQVTKIKSENGRVTVPVGSHPVYVLGVAPEVLPTARVVLQPGEAFPQDTVDGSAKYILFSGGREIVLDGTKSLPRDTPPGGWLLLKADTKDGVWRSDLAITVATPFSLAEAADDNSGPATKVLRLANRGDDALQGLLEIFPAMNRYGANTGDRWMIPDPGKVPIYASEVKLEPGETRDVKVDLSAVSASGSGKATALVARLADRFKREALTDLRPLKGTPQVYGVPKAERAPAIDGDLRDWKLELFQTIDSPDNLRTGVAEWQGPADLSFRLAVQYDENALYLAIKIRDDSHVQDVGSWRSSWQEDSIQLNFALYPNGRKGSDQPVPGLRSSPAQLGYAFFHEFCLALKGMTGREKPVIYRFEGPQPFVAGELPRDEVPIAVQRIGGETNYEIAIPWKELDRELVSFPKDREIGFGIVVNDVDVRGGAKSGRKAMGAFGTIDAQPEFGILKLQ